MGLDVTAYEYLEKIDCVFDADGEPIDPTTRETLDYWEYVRFYANPDFPGREGSVEQVAVYQYANSFGFPAGSYGGYNTWRDELAKLAGWPIGEYEQYGRQYPSHCVAAWGGVPGPFAELINFSDCEGVIDPEVSGKLSADFAAYQNNANLHPDGRFRERYANWRKAFDMASQGGAVKFH